MNYVKCSRCNGALRLFGSDFALCIRNPLYDTGLICLTVAGFGETLKWSIRQVSADPVQIGRHQALAIEQGVIMSLTDIKDVIVDVFADHIPRFFIGTL